MSNSVDTLLEICYSIEEINKAPRLDNFPLAFFQNHWDTVHVDLIRLCFDLFLGQSKPRQIN